MYYFQTPKRPGRRRKNSISTSPIQAVSNPLRISTPASKTPTAAMHYMNIATSILRTDGSFATVRVIRRKNQRFTAEQIIHVMNMMTNPQGNAMYVGEYHQLKKKIHVFYKCPPDTIKPKALQGYSMTWDTYNEQYFKSARPHKNGPIDWQNYLGTVRQFAPFELPLSDEDDLTHGEIEDEDDDFEGVDVHSPDATPSILSQQLSPSLSTSLHSSIHVTVSDDVCTTNSLYTTPPEAHGVESLHEEITQENCVIEEAVIHDWNSAS